ncbi:MAG: hypothetical protein CVV30_01335 [Methanomicrobiales archaeon HGW-Methanomicrobiales-1]|jgi:hypothetical protein|nr:MAG: hypothetical protein CVV30_01335 [Methanomicrobiales archaeon HGW-Methanomicrobiales-1]
MKLIYSIAIFGVLFLVLLSSGCTSTTPSVQTPVPTPVPTTVVTILSPTPTQVPYPNALALDQYATFGSGDEQGKATVYRYDVKPDYTWTSPSWNSPREQAAKSQPLELQPGYNIEKPQEGNTFLFVYVRVINTGDKAVYAPSAKQFVVFDNGKMYNYSSVHSSDVVIDTVLGTQYDYQIGRGGTVGYVQRGESNAADGYLIYEIPAPFIPGTTYVVSNLDNKNQAAWKLG